MKKSTTATGKGLSRRLQFPADEKRMPWLPFLLDAYAIADTGVAIAVRDREKKQGRKLACGQRCVTCCVLNKDLPLYPHEIVGIYWYATEKIAGPDRAALVARLAAVRGDCPFLIDERCVIYPFRPVGCRQFNVFSSPCAPGEDPYYTRRQDVLVPDQGYLDRVFAAVLPLYDLKRERDASGAIRAVRGQIMNLHSFDWSKLAGLMADGLAAP